LPFSLFCHKLCFREVVPDSEAGEGMTHSKQEKLPLSFRVALQAMGRPPLRKGTVPQLIRYVADTHLSGISLLVLQLPMDQVISILAEEGEWSRFWLSHMPNAIQQSSAWQSSARSRAIRSVVESAAVMIDAISEDIPDEVVTLLSQFKSRRRHSAAA
jgi:hypothetical protein